MKRLRRMRKKPLKTESKMEKSYIKTTFLFVLTILFFQTPKAQITIARQALSSHGILYQSPTPGIDVMSTAGESFIATLGSGFKLALTQGIQQPDHIYKTGIDPASGLPFEFKAYPNPASDQLILQFEGTPNRKIEVRLFDMRGRIIPSFKAEFRQSGEEIWQISSLAEGIYMLRLMDEHGKLLISEPILKQ